ncbi:hypothetical protein DYB30_008163 [Aphanomyces astaci]|uniref:EF-hand domain-containing protein n=1 Tax=Aphanomyces astaci TaxID=112090 RepID=A0A397D706_APHAT|nr:hypothetical protein DYB30_008163 [Aphanomyces astaci]
MFQKIRHKKAQVFGDKQKQANLPRLIGGRKSGTNTVHCSDCGASIVVTGKQDNDRMCMAQGCVNLFCDECYQKMAEHDKFCDDCYLHENGNIEVLGMQLRTMLLSKLAATDVQIEALDQIFQSLDENHSGDLSRDEFEHLLEKLRMHPPLTSNQVDGVFEELDVDNNGSLSFEEFKTWLLGRESMWSPRLHDDETSDSVASTRHLATSPTRAAMLVDKKNAGFLTFAQSLVEDMVTDACAMSSRSPWLLNSQPIEKTDLDKRLQTEHVLFQRVGAVQVMDNAMDEAGGIAKLFAKFDVNGDGTMEMAELSYLVQSIGLAASPVDLRLLAHRLHREDGATIHLADFVKFIQLGPSAASHERVLLDKIIDLEQRCKDHRIEEAEVKNVLSNFYAGMTPHELAWMAQQLHRLIGWSVDLPMLQRIALVCTPCIFDTTDAAKLVCAGDVLLALFSAPSGFAGSFASYSIQSVSDAIQLLFKIEQPDVEGDLEWEKLGQSPTAEMPQAKFVECLLRRGLKLDGDSLGIASQVCVALTLDTLRYREGGGGGGSSLYSTLKTLETRMRHILQQMARVGSGQQYYQTIITRTLDPHHALNVYVSDPSAHHVMQHSFCEADLSVNGVALFTSTDHLLSKTAVNPFHRGVVHDLWYPELNAYFVNLVKRFRILYTEDQKTPTLAFLESDALVARLRSVLTSNRVPFFWAVSAASLQISMDQAALDRSNLRLLPCVIQSVLKFPAIASFVRQTHSTLRVHFEVIDRPMSLWMSWSEFKSCLAGLQNAYTFVQLLPQGDTFHTPHDEGGGKTKSTTKNQPTRLHFVVLSVRRTVPKTSDKATLYCTAYDPITASDYEVVGTPTNWYNKQPRSDQLIGETEVSVASMMAREGYGIESWFSIYHPVSEVRGVLLWIDIKLSEIVLKDRIQELERKTLDLEATVASSDTAKWKRKVQGLKDELVALHLKASNPLDVQDFAAPATLAAIKAILNARCPERPYNGLKKAMAAVADSPGKVPCDCQKRTVFETM